MKTAVTIFMLLIIHQLNYAQNNKITLENDDGGKTVEIKPLNNDGAIGLFDKSGNNTMLLSGRKEGSFIQFTDSLNALRIRLSIDYADTGSSLYMLDQSGGKAELTANEGFGLLRLSSNDESRLTLHTDQNAGVAKIYGPNSTNVILGPTYGGDLDKGKITVHNENGDQLIELHANGENGRITILDTLEEEMARFAALTDTSGKSFGFMSLSTVDGTKVVMHANEKTGTGIFKGPNSTNVIIGNEEFSKDRGQISLHNEDGKSLIDIETFSTSSLMRFADTTGNWTAGIGTIPDFSGSASDGTNAGFLLLGSNDGSLAVQAGTHDVHPNNGYISIHSDSNAINNVPVLIYSNSNNFGNGAIDLFSTADTSASPKPKATFFVSDDHSGEFNLFGPNDNPNVGMGIPVGFNENYGWLGVYDDDGNARVRFYPEPTRNGAGVLHTFGSNGSFNTFVGAFGQDDRGHLMALDENNTAKSEMFIDTGGEGWARADIVAARGASAFLYNDNGVGTLQADVKNFSMAHPSKSDKRIVYACIEGPEAAAYSRGTALLIDGKARIILPEHFQLVASETGMTVILTPLSANSKGIAVTLKSLDGVEVQEMFEGKGNYEFDWEVKSIRKGYENYEVIRDKKLAFEENLKLKTNLDPLKHSIEQKKRKL